MIIDVFVYVFSGKVFVYDVGGFVNVMYVFGYVCLVELGFGCDVYYCFFFVFIFLG